MPIAEFNFAFYRTSLTFDKTPHPKFHVFRYFDARPALLFLPMSTIARLGRIGFSRNSGRYVRATTYQQFYMWNYVSGFIE